MHVYERVRMYLDANEIEESSVAEAAGISDASLRAMLSGKETMYADDLRAICIALGVSADAFVGMTPFPVSRRPRGALKKRPVAEVALTPL